MSTTTTKPVHIPLSTNTSLVIPLSQTTQQILNNIKDFYTNENNTKYEENNPKYKTFNYGELVTPQKENYYYQYQALLGLITMVYILDSIKIQNTVTENKKLLEECIKILLNSTMFTDFNNEEFINKNTNLYENLQGGSFKMFKLFGKDNKVVPAAIDNTAETAETHKYNENVREAFVNPLFVDNNTDLKKEFVTLLSQFKNPSQFHIDSTSEYNKTYRELKAEIDELSYGKLYFNNSDKSIALFAAFNRYASTICYGEIEASKISIDTAFTVFSILQDYISNTSSLMLQNLTEIKEIKPLHNYLHVSDIGVKYYINVSKDIEIPVTSYPDITKKIKEIIDNCDYYNKKYIDIIKLFDNINIFELINAKLKGNKSIEENIENKNIDVLFPVDGKYLCLSVKLFPVLNSERKKFLMTQVLQSTNFNLQNEFDIYTKFSTQHNTFKKCYMLQRYSQIYSFISYYQSIIPEGKLIDVEEFKSQIDNDYKNRTDINNINFKNGTTTFNGKNTVLNPNLFYITRDLSIENTKYKSMGEAYLSKLKELQTDLGSDVFKDYYINNGIMSFSNIRSEDALKFVLRFIYNFDIKQFNNDESDKTKFHRYKYTVFTDIMDILYDYDNFISFRSSVIDYVQKLYRNGYSDGSEL